MAHSLSTKVVGIVNVTADSFSDGGRYLDPLRAAEHARRLREDGADVVELGAASSHPDAADVPAEQEIERLAPVVDALRPSGIALGVDSWKPATQRWCIERGFRMVNDIEGFRDPDAYGDLADADCLLVVMHSVQRRGKATRQETDADGIVDEVIRFFEGRVGALTAAGIARDRLVLDPGMGFFLGRNPEPSLRVLARLDAIGDRLGLPMLVSVSRKSFLGALTGRAVDERGPAGLAAELDAVRRGAAWIRTHDVRALRDALTVSSAIGAVTLGRAG